MIRPRYTLLAAGLSLLVLIGGRTAANDNPWTDAAGNFTWNTTSADWTSPTIWNNANVDGAFFGATGVGTITLATPITVRGLEFNANAYTISGSGANVLTLAHGTTGSLLDGEIQVASGFGDGVSAGTAGTVGLTKTGAGIIVLTGTNTYSGGTTVSAGGVQTGNGGTAGTLPSGNVSIANGGQFLFRLDNTSDLALGNNFSGAGQLVFDGVNVSDHSSFQLTGNNSGYSGSRGAWRSPTDYGGEIHHQPKVFRHDVQVSSHDFLSDANTYTGGTTISDQQNRQIRRDVPHGNRRGSRGSGFK